MENSGKDDKQSKEGNQKLPLRGLMVWLLLLVLFLGMFQVLSQGHESYERVEYNPTFIQYVEDGKVSKCTIVREMSGIEFIRGKLTDMDAKTQKPKRFKVEVIASDELLQWLRKYDVQFSVKTQNPVFYQLLSSFIPIILLLGLLYFLFIRQMKNAGRGAMNFGKSRAKLLTRSKNRISFKDVAGVDEAKEEMSEIVDFLKDPKKFQKLGGRIPKGVLLVGAPGTGKTLLAKAIAGEAEVPFFSISGSDFVEMFVGVGASRVRDMFEQAKKNAPCIIFIDEIDAVGRSRFSGIGGGHDEREQTLNALLVEMDGFETQEGVIIIAATNRPDVLDNALLRPGRFDRQITVDLPPLEGRVNILEIHTKKIKLSEDVDLHRVARGTPGFSGADLANLVNEAALLAARRSASEVHLQDLEEARDKVRWGSERRSRMMDEKEKELTAYHEAGHAIVLELLDHTEPLHKVTIIPRGASLGSTMQLPEKDQYTQGKKKLLAMLVGLMGGRAAEELVLDDITTGAYSDLKQATGIARAMVCEYGMSDVMGPQTFGEKEELLFLGRDVQKTSQMSEETIRKIDNEVTSMLTNSYNHAIQLLKNNRSKLDALAEALLEYETLDGEHVKQIVEHGHLIDIPDRKKGEAKDEGSSDESAETASTVEEELPGIIPPPETGPSPA